MNEEKNREIKISIPLPDDFFSALLPTAVVGHLRNARKEVLLAVRALIDDRLETIEKGRGEKAAPKRKIKVE
jgi:hypothetical protein